MNKFLISAIALCALSNMAQAGGNHSHQHHASHTQHGAHAQMSSIGAPGAAKDVKRTVQIVMDDKMRFAPDKIEVRAGETLRLQVRNAGQLRHEFVLGQMAELQAHAEMMRQQPDMQHEEPNMLSLAGGASGEIIWRFGKSGTLDFACLIAGHFEAGMRGRVKVK
ncbi:cupredoxin family protein [Massilia sp. W12]|uniref:cupredoxin domain-containing protein n=1 Tax=Massilia sp. W12 TaxID=3126507 RepID=UPI0030D4B2C5